MIKPIARTKCLEIEEKTTSARLDDITQKINDKLLKGSRSISVQSLGLKSYGDDRLIERIISLYKGEGWDVKRVKFSCQRDDYEQDDLEFT